MKRNNYFLPFVSLISIILTQLGYWPYNSFYTPFLNCFNFLIYFALGRFIRGKYQELPNISFSFVMISLFVLIFVSPFAHSYFSIAGVLTGIAATIMLFKIAILCNWNILVHIGKISFVIYFLHMHIGGAISRRLIIIHGTPLEWLKVVVAFIFVCFIVEIFYICLKKMKCYHLLQYLGYR